MTLYWSRKLGTIEGLQRVRRPLKLPVVLSPEDKGSSDLSSPISKVAA